MYTNMTSEMIESLKQYYLLCHRPVTESIGMTSVNEPSWWDK